MEKFSVLTSTAVPVNVNNIDTDQIIPARFLKGTSKAGFGARLFHDWRYDNAGQPRSEFILNQPAYKEAKILLAPHNLGCGSSREHAPWAIVDYGFRAMIAISFADIFRNNSLKNGLLPVALPEPVVMKLIELTTGNPALTLTIDLAAQEVRIPGLETQTFEIDPYRKKCLLNGLDDIGYTLSHQQAIADFESRHTGYPIAVGVR